MHYSADQVDSIQRLSSNAPASPSDRRLIRIHVPHVGRRDLFRHSNKFKAILETMEDGVLICSAEKTIEYANPAMIRLIGHDATGEKCHKVFHDRDEPCPDCKCFKGIGRTWKITRDGDERVYRVSNTPFSNQGGGSIIEVIRDITDSMRIENTLYSREVMLGVVANAAKDFFCNNDWEKTMDRTLSDLGKATASSRGLIVQHETNANGQVLASVRHEWFAPGLTSLMNTPFAHQFIYARHGLKRWREMLGRGEIIHGNISDFSPAEQKVLTSRNIKSILIVPILVNHKTWGYIGLDQCRENRCWDAVEIEAVRAAANILGGALDRKHEDEVIKLNCQQHERITNGMINSMTKVVEFRDPYTAGHERRVAALAIAIAARMGMSADQLKAIRIASILHDIGKMYVPAEILGRTGKLTDVEIGIIRIHPSAGYEILHAAEFQWPIADMVLQHHERMDGSGYPNGLRADSILPEVRIISVADVVEAMSSHRPYRAALGIEAALEEIILYRGSQFDPGVVDACIDVFNNEGFKYPT